MDVHGIHKSTIATLVKAKKKGDIVYNEQRGNKKKNRKYALEDEQAIIDYVNSLPKQKSHYTRAKNDKDYLSEDLNFNRMFQAFKELHPQTIIMPRFYRDTVKKTLSKTKFSKTPKRYMRNL